MVAVQPQQVNRVLYSGLGAVRQGVLIRMRLQKNRVYGALTFSNIMIPYLLGALT